MTLPHIRCIFVSGDNVVNYKPHLNLRNQTGREKHFMSRMIAYCGLVCSDCPAFLATQNDDDAAREKTAAMYAEKYGFSLKAGDINCDGCVTVGGRLIEYYDYKVSSESLTLTGLRLFDVVTMATSDILKSDEVVWSTSH
ncbi:MAG TPA: DUF3795 domain-containing protein [Spirochaetia bacterium]|nr:DUF3795 domain-containing protein [Spirochaetia bacterium]